MYYTKFHGHLSSSFGDEMWANKDDVSLYIYFVQKHNKYKFRLSYMIHTRAHLAEPNRESEGHSM
jgi:hypothetical protein